MNTKEAIKVIKICKSKCANDLPYGEDAAYDYLKRENSTLDEIIDLLHCYEKMREINHNPIK